jgi:hypothetical protein
MSRNVDAPPPPKKRPYRAPVLTTYGDLKTITMAKAGASADGTGKPRTKLSGANA